MSASPRKTPRQARAQATVEAILEATERCLVDRGYDRTTTNRIAKVAGVSIGSLYQYFPNKEALIAELFRRHTSEVLAVSAVRLQELATAPIHDAARAVVEIMVEAHRVNPELHRVLMEQVPRVGMLAELLSIDDEAELLLKTFMTARARNGEIRQIQPELGAFMVVNAVISATHAAVLHRPEILGHPDFTDELTELVVRYISL